MKDIAAEKDTGPAGRRRSQGVFTGHVTLARMQGVKPAQAEILSKLALGMAGKVFGEWMADKVELIRKWKGGPGEHGAHGIVLGPDKKLYVVCGNFVDVPDDRLPNSPHRNYADDLLPRFAEPQV